MSLVASFYETEFERRRGVSQVTVRPGFAQIHVESEAESPSAFRLAVLAAVAEANIRISMLKLESRGLSFLVEADRVDAATDALKGFSPGVRSNCSLIEVHAVNMRDEEGLIARVIATAIASGATMNHVGDMHDRILIAVVSSDAQPLADQLFAALAQEDAS